MQIRKNDMVVLLKDFSGPTPARKGSTARVLKAFPKLGKIICEHVNIKYKHVRAKTNSDYPEGGIIRKEAPIDASNVALYCPKCEKKTRAVRKVVEAKKVRSCAKCGEAL